MVRRPCAFITPAKPSAERGLFRCRRPLPAAPTTSRFLADVPRPDSTHPPQSGGFGFGRGHLPIQPPSRRWACTTLLHPGDLGNGDLGTKVYPTKVSFTKKTHWRTRTEVSEDWIRVVNFHVNAFGEWQAGSEEAIKSGTYKSVPRQM